MSAATFTCRICGRTSWNPNDAAHGYCGACHGYTAEPPPPGLRWVVFRGGELDGVGRLVEERGLDVGASYVLMSNDEPGYVFDGHEFVQELIVPGDPRFALE